VHLSSEQLLQLVDCLHETFKFSREFNCNHEQRNLLWKAGFKGKDKPNLLKHETQSLACILRILFKMYNDESRKDYFEMIQVRLINISQNSLQYYMILPAESHRESWENILLLLLTKICKLEAQKVFICFVEKKESNKSNLNFKCLKFKIFSSALYRNLCDILLFNFKPELRNVLRELFLQIGNINAIPSI